MACSLLRLTWALTNKICGISTLPDPVLSSDPRKIAVYEMGPGWGFIQINCRNSDWVKFYHNYQEIRNNKCGKFGPATTKVIYQDYKYYRDDATLLDKSYQSNAESAHRATLSLAGKFTDYTKVLVVDGTLVIPSDDIGGYELVCSDDEYSHFGKKLDYCFIKNDDRRSRVWCENIHYPDIIKGESWMVNPRDQTLEIHNIKFKFPPGFTHHYYDKFIIYKYNDAFIIHLPTYAPDTRNAAFLERAF